MIYRLVRQIHLISAVVLAAFILMYFVTGYVLVRSSWFGEGAPRVARRLVRFEPSAESLNEEDLSRRLQELTGVRGQPLPPRKRDDRTSEFRFSRPGYEASIIQNEAGGQLEVTEKYHRWQRTSIGLHRLHGYRGGWLYWIWAAFMDLSSLAMIVFAITGIWMWFKLERTKWPGFALLAVGLAYTLTTIFYLLN